jgi:hypothetical protein
MVSSGKDIAKLANTAATKNELGRNAKITMHEWTCLRINGMEKGGDP